jgi:hypothetical protein
MKLISVQSRGNRLVRITRRSNISTFDVVVKQLDFNGTYGLTIKVAHCKAFFGLDEAIASAEYWLEGAKGAE